MQNIGHVGFCVDIAKAGSVYFATALPADEDPIILPSTESLAFIGLFFLRLRICNIFLNCSNSGFAYESQVQECFL